MIVLVIAGLLSLTGCNSSPSSAPASQPAAAAPQKARQEAAPPPAAAAPAGDDKPTVKLSNARGAAGETVAVEFTLAGGKNAIIAAATDVHYDPAVARVAAKPGGEPDCEVSAAAGPQGAKKTVFARERQAGGEAMLRIALLGMQSAEPLEDGLLFTCRFKIDAAAGAGDKQLRAETTATDARATALSINPSTAVISVN